MQLHAPQQRFLHDMFTIESNGKNNTGAILLQGTVRQDLIYKEEEEEILLFRG